MSVVYTPRNAWTLVAPAGFASANVHIQGNVSLLYHMGAAAPSALDTTTGGVLTGTPLQQTIGNDFGFGLWLRPAIPDTDSWVRLG